MTDDENLPKRPNAKYKLSKPDGSPDPEEKLTFYYSRERRLENAPQAVKDLYAKTQKHSRFNLLRPLVADKPRATLFFTIVVLSAVILILGVVGRLDKSYSLDGYKIEVSGTRFEGTSIIVLSKTLKKGNTPSYSGAVDIAISPAADTQKGVTSFSDEEFPVFIHRVFFTMEPVEEYRFAVPFDSPELLIVLQSEKNTLKARVKPK